MGIFVQNILYLKLNLGVELLVKHGYPLTGNLRSQRGAFRVGIQGSGFVSADAVVLDAQPQVPTLTGERNLYSTLVGQGSEAVF